MHGIAAWHAATNIIVKYIDDQCAIIILWTSARQTKEGIQSWPQILCTCCIGMKEEELMKE
jgi:hypothetical protein